MEKIAKEVADGDDANRPAVIIKANKASEFDISEKFKNELECSAL